MFLLDICDAPVRSPVGYSSCERCMIKESLNWRVVFNDDDVFRQRTNADFSQMKYDCHQKWKIQLLQIQFSCVSGFVLDYMHLVCLGVVKWASKMSFIKWSYQSDIRWLITVEK